MEEKLHSISVIGTGLIGASLGKALKGKFFVKGYDKNADNLSNAMKTNAIDFACENLYDAFDADAVVISIPVQFIPEFIEKNATNFKKGSVITDTGSTKAKVIKAMEHLPEGVEFIGGHPIAGKEKSGPLYADKNLFRGKKFVLTEENRLSDKGKSLVSYILKQIGAVPVLMKAGLHDKILSYTSYFPYFASSALFELVSEKEKEIPGIFDFAGSGLKDTTRIASGDVLMSVGMLETNKENVLNALKEYMEILKRMEEKLKSGELEENLKEIKERRDKVWK